MLALPQRLLAACLLLLAASGAAAQEARTFRYKMDPGDQLIYRLTTETKIAQSIAGMSFDSEVKNADVSIRTLQKVDDDGNLVIQSENKIIKASLSAGPAGDYSYDSQSPTNEKGSVLGAALTPLYDTLKGAYITLTVSPRGEVVKLQGLSDLVSGVLKDNPLTQQFGGMMGTDEAGAMTYGDSFVRFPEHAIKPGDTWKVPFELTVPKMGTFKGETAYKYEGPDKVGDRATIRITEKTTMTFDLNIESDAAAVTGTISSMDGSATAHFDPELGQMVSKKSTMKLGGTLNVKAGGQDLMLQQDQDVTTTFELLEKLPE
jgi:hypothetical protein